MKCVSCYPTCFRDSKYSAGLVRAVKAASWNGAGAESVSLMWIFLMADAMHDGAIAHPILHPNDNRTNFG